MKKWIATTSLVLIGLSITCSLHAAEKKQAENREKTVITAERLTFDYTNRFAFFEKDVVVKDPDMTLHADTLKVLFGKDNKAQAIRAEGNVVIEQKDRKATSGLAIYDVVGGKIVLKVNPVVRRGEDALQGDVITYWRDKNLMICEPGARLVIYPGESGTDRNLLLGE